MINLDLLLLAGGKVMKLYKKTKLLAIRVNEFMDARITRCEEHLQLDRSDMIRMFINNALKYWEGEMVKNELKVKYQAHDHAYTNQDLEYIANKEIKTQLVQNQISPKQTALPLEPKKSRQLLKK
jgi:hypothetical protein